MSFRHDRILRLLIRCGVMLCVATATHAAELESQDSRLTVHAQPRPLATGAVTTDWPHFLGPTRDGVSTETCLVKDLEDLRLLWSTEAGAGYAAPSVKDGLLVYPHAIGDREIIECRDAQTGTLRWSHGYPTDYQDRYNYLPGPRATPAIDGDRVYTLGVQGVLSCLELASGGLVWQRQTGVEFEIDQGFFGFTTSPLIEGDLLIVNLGGGKCVWAFDKADGAIRWKAGDEWGRSYATPLPVTIHDQRVVLVFAGGMAKPPAGGLLVLDPSSGEIRSRYPWRSVRYTSVNAQTPVFARNRVFVSTIYDAGGVLLEVQSDLSMKIIYKTRAYSSHWMTPILKDGHLYGFANDRLVCMEWDTGEEVWQCKLRDKESGDRFGTSSLIFADGRFLCLGDTGLLAWLDLSPQGHRIFSTRRLFDSRQAWTAPVLSRGLLYVAQNLPTRNHEHPPRLLCYDARGARP